MGRYVQVIDANWRIPYTGGWCLQYVRQAYGQPARYPDASSAWNASKSKHYDYPPAGITVPVYFSLGSTNQGHIAIRLDDLMVASSTQSGTHPKGYLHPNIKNLIDMYAKYNNGCTYLGWTEDIAGTTVVRYEPTITTEDITTTEAIPFTTETKDDPTLPLGEVKTTQEGGNGLRTIVTRITRSDGTEVSRAVISDTTIAPVSQIILNGTYVAPEPEPIPEPVEPPIEPQPEVTDPEIDYDKVKKFFNRMLHIFLTFLQSFLKK